MSASTTANEVVGLRPATWACVSAVLFIALGIVFGSAGDDPTRSAMAVMGSLGVAFHLALVPVLLHAQAPGWAKVAGLVWIAIDITANALGIGGMSVGTVTTIRLVGHVPASLWVVTVSLALSGIVRPVGVVLGAWLLGYSLVAAWVPEAAFMPAMALMAAWLPLLGRALSRL